VIVLDTSAAIHALATTAINPELTQRIAGAGSLHAPHLIDSEMLAALAGLVRGRKLTSHRALDAQQDFADLPIVRYPLAGVAERVWELRHSVAIYDACFVALAEVLSAPLVTSDQRLARSRGHRASIELYPPMTPSN
jgi:predicted nucleic acid-binding protein